MSYTIKGLERKIIFKINSNDFDAMVHQYLGDLIKSEKINSYEFAPYEECSNYDVKSYSVKNVFENHKKCPDYFDSYIENWKQGNFHWNAHVILEFLVLKGILEEGEYLVTTGLK